MKILWLSNKELTIEQTSSTGTWLQAMALGLGKYQDVELCNITMGNSIKTITRRDCGKIKQWIVPLTKLVDGLPPQNIIRDICDIIKSISPRIVHIWGVEYYWGLLSARGYINYPVLLEIQGLRYTCAEAYYGGMSIHDMLSSIRLIDLIATHRRIDRQKASHKAWGVYEKEMLLHHKYISTQSEWVRASIKPYCKDDVRIFKTKMAVRREFMESKPWQYPRSRSNIQLLSISSSAIPYKGVHIVLRAIAVLKQKYPTIKLKLVGNYMQNRLGIYKPGYIKFIERLISDLNIKDNVVFTNSLSGIELEEEMQKSLAVINSSFVESYSLSLAESMAVGVPCVISYAGAMSELAENGISGLFYSPCDYYKCAYCIARLIDDMELAQNISTNARKLALARNNINDVVVVQKGIYDEIVKQEPIKTKETSPFFD